MDIDSELLLHGLHRVKDCHCLFESTVTDDFLSFVGNLLRFQRAETLVWESLSVHHERLRPHQPIAILAKEYPSVVIHDLTTSEIEYVYERMREWLRY